MSRNIISHCKVFNPHGRNIVTATPFFGEIRIIAENASDSRRSQEEDRNLANWKLQSKRPDRRDLAKNPLSQDDTPQYPFSVAPQETE